MDTVDVATSTLERLSDAVQKGQATDVLALLGVGLEQGISAAELLDDGLLKGMSLLGVRFSNNEAWVPEVLLAARALNEGMDFLKPKLIEAGVASKGKVVIGTVAGDMHDVGKNLVKMMMEGSGLEVIDLGVNVPDEQFVAAIRTHSPDVVCLSALLTSTMGQMKLVIDAIVAAGLRDSVKVLVGGAPVTSQAAAAMGADGTAPDASSAAELACRIIGLAARR